MIGCYWRIELEWRYWWLRGILKLLNVGECIVGSCMLSGADWMLRGIEC